MTPESMRLCAQEHERWDTNSGTRDAITALLAADDDAALAAAFGGRLEFGTAGLRAPMGPGSLRMNEVTVMQAAQGLVAHLLAVVPDAATRGIVVGWDHRARGTLSSRRFALVTAAACVARGVRVHLFGRLTATPLVAFGVLHLGAAAGVMVTASHNPAADNGYKVYWGNGAQIVSPADKAIASSIESNGEPWDARGYADALDCGVGEAALLTHALVSDPAPALISAYLCSIAAALSRGGGGEATRPVGSAAMPPSHGVVDLSICYTAMHGVGTVYAESAFHAFGLPPFFRVDAQCAPDASFPTVTFPNPEEAGALTLAFAAADAANASLVLANDPDADRLAIAEWQPEGVPIGTWVPRVRGARGSWRSFTGNEVGALLAGWAWRGFKEGGGLASDALMAASTVSSSFLGAMALAEGFHFTECLTGFKYMGNAMAQGQARGLTPIFAFEEAIGYCCGAVVRDKDGISAAAVTAQAARTHASEGRTLAGALSDLYTRYGARAQNNGYVFASPPVQASIFARLTNEGHYWSRLGPLNITRVRDLRAPGFDSAIPSRVPFLPTSSSHMLTYTFDNGVVATLRGSGTEPKLKWYAEGGSATDVDATVTLLVDEMIQPQAHGLTRPAPMKRDTTGMIQRDE